MHDCAEAKAAVETAVRRLVSVAFLGEGFGVWAVGLSGLCFVPGLAIPLLGAVLCSAIHQGRYWGACGSELYCTPPIRLSLLVDVLVESKPPRNSSAECFCEKLLTCRPHPHQICFICRRCPTAKQLCAAAENPLWISLRKQRHAPCVTGKYSVCSDWATDVLLRLPAGYLMGDPSWRRQESPCCRLCQRSSDDKTGPGSWLGRRCAAALCPDLG